MASDTSSPHGEGRALLSSIPAEQLTANLQIVSPSVAVSRPLLFPGIAVTTTIKQLKEKIRESLPLRPADDHQRLIHRGRALMRETDSLLDIFGEPTVCDPASLSCCSPLTIPMQLRAGEQVTMHLVVRELMIPQSIATAAAGTTNTSTSTDRGRSPAPRAVPSVIPQANPVSNATDPRIHPGLPRPNRTHANLNPFRGISPSPTTGGFEPGGEPQAQHQQQQHQHMTNLLTQLQREAVARHMGHQPQAQRHRAALGLSGIGDLGGQGPTTGFGARQRSPAPGQTVYREAIGPNGQVYQVETTIRSNGPAASMQTPGLSPAEVHTILRNADISQVQASFSNNVQRSASSASLRSRYMAQGAPQPTSTVPEIRSGRATPEVGMRSVSASSAPPTGRPAYDVYILSSPEGPRALLVNTSSSDTYYSPRLRTQASNPQLGTPISPLPINYQHLQEALHQRPATPLAFQGPAQDTPDQQPAGGQGQGQPPAQARQENGVAGEGIAHPHNPAAAPLIAGLWPHIWMAIRLSVLVYLITGPSTSWGRFLVIIGIALIVGVIGTGGLDGVAGFVRRAMGRQLANLIPRIDQLNRPDRPFRPLAGRDGHEADRGDNQALEDMAGRLFVEQQQEDAWIATQYRRLERATLLFLASLAPGLAEGHIANLEAEAERERQAAEAARRAAEAEAEAARNAEAEGGDNNAHDQTSDEASEAPPDNHNPEGQAPLIAV